VTHANSSHDAARGRFVCVVLHDVASSTRAACQRVLDSIARVAEVPVTLLAVPRYHGETPSLDFEAWLGQRSARGDELALHGWTHRDELPATGTIDRVRRRHYTRSEGEFAALPEAEARQRIAAGVAWFRDHGWPLRGFVAPAWLLGPGAWAAVGSFDFEYTSTLRQIVHLPDGRPVGSQSVVYSTSNAWRRQTSLAWNAMVSRIEKDNQLLRIELHPRDADFTAIRRSWQTILQRAMRDRHATTVAEFMRQDRAAGAAPTTAWPATRAD